MPQKLLDPIRRIPHQIQNLDIIKKLHDLTSGRHSDNLDYSLSSSYGILEGWKSLAFDAKLGLLAIGSETGCIKVYGAPGVVFSVLNEGPSIIALDFLPNEGRLVCACDDGSVALFELDTTKGSWSCRCRVNIPRINDQEKITCLAVGLGVVYIGFTTGTLRQIAVKDGRMTVGDDILTACTANYVIESVPVDKRNQLGVDSPIVSLEIQPEGNHLLVAYAGGCVAVAIPQPIPIQTPVHSAVINGNAAPTAECEIVTPIAEDEVTPTVTEQAKEDAPKETNENEKVENEEPKVRLSVDESGAKPATNGHTKEHSEKRTTLKFKSLTRSLRPFESQKPEKEVEPPLPVPPTPRISHLLIRDQPVEWATWRVTAVGTLSTEVTVAYGDGAFQVWPINATVSQQPSEPIIVSKRDPPNTPYGPMPCGAIKKILINPSSNGGVFTVFSGGLPRPQFENRHAVSVLQDHDHHVCFQFGSEVKDFILIPAPESAPAETEAPTEIVTKPSSPSASVALLVLTERELVAIDLTSPNWPTFNSPYLTCLDYSPVTAVAHIGEVPTSLIRRLQSATQSGTSDTTTTHTWPIWGGESTTEGLDFADNVGNDIVLLGHANGWVTLWLIGRGDTVHHLGTIPTAALFNPADLQQEQNGNACQALEEETWPPFKPVGHCSKFYRQFGDYSDSRLAVTQICVQLGNPMHTESSPLAMDSLTVVIGGAGGQISTWTTGSEGTKPSNEVVLFEADVAKITVNLLTASDEAKYVWKDAQSLKTLEGPSPLLNASGLAFYPCGLVQMNPPAPVSAIALESAWNLLAVGSPLGFGIIDLLSRSVLHTVFTHATVSATKPTNPVSTVQNAIVSRGKQFTATMRQSFKRLKNLRTSLSTPDKTHEEAPAPAPAPATDDSAQPAENVTPAEKTAETTAETKPTEEPKASGSEQAPKAETSEPATAPAQEDGDHNETKTDTSPWSEQSEPTALSRDDFGVSGIRSLLFVDTFVVNPVATNPQQPAPLPTRSPSLWVGTGNGKALAYTLNWDGSSGPVNVYLIKELQLQHRSPIVRMCVLDASNHSPVVTSNRQRISLEVPQPEATKEPEAAPAPPPTEETQPAEEGTSTAPPTEATTTTTTTPSPPVAQETHQLLLCSEEQVKLFSLPSLRAGHKHKFFDRLRLQHSQTHTKTGISVSLKQTKEVNEEGDATAAAATGGAEPETETKPQSTTTSTTTTTSHHRKLVQSFGVQSFVCGTAEQPKTEWNAVATLLDGQIAILNLPNLRKIFKERECRGLSSGIVCVRSHNSNNIVVWFVGSQLLTAELGSKSNLMSLAVSNSPNVAPLVKIPLPEWMRPQKPAASAPTELVDELVDAAQPITATVTEGATAVSTALAGEIDTVASAVTNGTTEVVQSVTEVVENTVTGLNDAIEKTEQSLIAGAQAVGDVTLDSIKDYWNGEGTVTIRTTESSTEKRTLVEGGKITTTVHEVQKVDGKVTKDDVVKIVSDNESEVPAIAGTS